MWPKLAEKNLQNGTFEQFGLEAQRSNYLQSIDHKQMQNDAEEELLEPNPRSSERLDEPRRLQRNGHEEARLKQPNHREHQRNRQDHHSRGDRVAAKAHRDAAIIAVVSALHVREDARLDHHQPHAN